MNETLTSFDELRRLAPELEIVSEGDALSERAHDWWMRALLERRLGAVQRARAVVRPGTTADVVAILAWAHRTRTPVVPYGLGSGVCGAVLVSRGEVVVDLGKMTDAGAVDETSLTVTVQPGVRGSSLESSLAAAGYTTGHYPQSIDLSSVGGWCATRAIGQFSTKYGGIEDAVLGLEAVLPGGRTIRLPAVPRTSTGPDLRELFLGSEGTLGVLTELTLRVHPSAASRAACSFSFSTVEAGMETLRLALREGWRPAVTRLYDATESARNFSLPGPVGATLLLLSEGPRTLVAAESEALRAIAIGQGGTDQGPDPVDHWMGHRNRVPRFEDLVDQGLVVDTIEVAVGWRSLPRLFGEVVQAGSAVPDMLSMSGHVSHCYLQGANIYFTFVGTCKDPQAAIGFYDRVWELTMQRTHSLGGTIAHHHGIGRVRKHWLSAELGSALELLRQIKATVDPHGIMNPGALLDDT